MLTKENLIRKAFEQLQKDYPGRRFVISKDLEYVKETTKRDPFENA